MDNFSKVEKKWYIHYKVNSNEKFDFIMIKNGEFTKAKVLQRLLTKEEYKKYKDVTIITNMIDLGGN